MIAVTTHINADFDALASLVAAGLLYPGALRILPGQVQPAVEKIKARDLAFSPIHHGSRWVSGSSQ